MVKYDELAQQYFKRRKDKTRFDYNRDIEVPALIKIIGSVKEKIVLDMGCGFGDHANLLSKKGFKRLFGFDISKKLVNIANERKIKNAKFYFGDMNKRLDHKNSYFDIVYSGLSIHYVNNINKLFKEVNRVLKKKGIFCFSTGHPIFNLLNQNEEGIISIKKNKDGKKVIFGDYFDEKFKLNNLGSLGKIKLRNFTFETLIKTGLKNGFELVDYIDAKPNPISKKINSEKYELTTTLPSFIIFKFRKK